jgi:hypothetical protein
MNIEDEMIERAGKTMAREIDREVSRRRTGKDQ